MQIQSDPEAEKFYSDMVSALPQELISGESRDKKNAMASLNKAVETIYLKISLGKKIQPYQLEKIRARLFTVFLKFYVGDPLIRLDEYDARHGTLRMNIVNKQNKGDEESKMTIPIDLKVSMDQAKYIGENIAYITPMVFFQLDNGTLTAKYLDFAAMHEINQKLASFSAPLANGIPLDIRIYHAFGLSQAASYEKDMQAAKNARHAEFEASVKRYQWYPIYASFLENPIACAVMKSEIMRAGIMKGESPQDQAWMTQYAKRVAASSPNCVK